MGTKSEAAKPLKKDETAAWVKRRLSQEKTLPEILPIDKQIQADTQERKNRAFHAVVVTADAAFLDPASSSGRKLKVAPALSGLIARGIRVFLVTTERLSPVDGITQILLKGQATQSTLVNVVVSEGIKFDNLLIAVDCRNELIRQTIGLLQKLQDQVIPAETQRLGPLLMPFCTNGDFLYEGNPVFRPVIKGSQDLKGVDALQQLIATHVLARPISLTELSTLVKSEDVLTKLMPIAGRAKEFKERGLKLLRERAAFLENPSVEVFDDRSGAIFFRPDEWRDVEAIKGKALNEYFSEKLPDFWEADRPCRRRVLYTPTKVLLRGEAYYANMRNESPFVRIMRMVEEMSAIREVLANESSTNGKDIDQATWKLIAALLDQARNIALQFYSFVHATQREFESSRPDVCASMETLRGDRSHGITGLLNGSTAAFYAWIFSDYALAATNRRTIVDCWTAVEKNFKKAVDAARSNAMDHQIRLSDLVRRWREADHPGENLLTALIAEEDLHAEDITHVVGIGWGGIELPLVYHYLRGGSGNVQVHIAQFSHYRGGTRDNPVKWMQFPDPGATMDVKGKTVLVFDDNTSTGYTLERVRDDLLLRGARDVKMYVTRYSGERRYAHMKMKEHGVVDPELLSTEIGGFIGETPFARSWSAKPKDYKSPIGVFSLPRRRILECIHNNSTVQLYDREGF